MRFFKSKEKQNGRATKVGCGETKFCNECKINSGNANDCQQKLFTLNALGRCDFYRGPFETTVKV